jgi:hypothetical protein
MKRLLPARNGEMKNDTNLLLLTLPLLMSTLIIITGPQRPIHEMQ